MKKFGEHNKLSAELHIMSLKELGKGLHLLQDISAHKDEFVRIYSIGDYNIHSHLHTKEPDDPGDYRNPNKRYFECRDDTYEYFVSVIILIITVWIVLTEVSIYPQELRPIKIKVVDSQTLEPVPNILVFRYVKTSKVLFSCGIPVTYYEYRNVIKEQKYTSDEGYVYFPKRRLFLRITESIFKETIYINLNVMGGTSPDDFLDNTKSIYNPKDNLKGVLIVSAKTDLIPEENLSPPEYRKEEFNIILNSKSLKKEKDEIIVKLERW